jgi:hypothetical protein
MDRSGDQNFCSAALPHSAPAGMDQGLPRGPGGQRHHFWRLGGSRQLRGTATVNKRPHTPSDRSEESTAKVVIAYSGVQILDCREHIRIKIAGTEPAGFRAGLKAAGFKPAGEQTWERPHTTAAIVEAQAILNVFFPADKK